MIRVTVKLLDSGEKKERYGFEKECETFLRHLFPTETENAHRLMACVSAINDEGFAEVEVEPYREPRERNVLPSDYDSGEYREDPWKRKGDE